LKYQGEVQFTTELHEFETHSHREELHRCPEGQVNCRVQLTDTDVVDKMNVNKTATEITVDKVFIFKK
jgi:hypothetical protein